MRRKKLNLLGLDGSLYLGRRKAWRDGDIENQDQVDASVSFSYFYIFYAIVVVAALLFVGRLFALTVVHGAENKSLAENNRVRLLGLEAPRGKIYDRNGKVLAESQNHFFLKKGDKDEEISVDKVMELERTGQASENFEGDLGQILKEVRRSYTLGEASSHILGYTSVEQEEETGGKIARANAVGRLGVEANYDKFLEGKVGKKLIEVDAEGKKVSILGTQDAIEGRSIRTNIDLDLQKVAYESLKNYADKLGSRRGAVIIQKPQTGEILALASVPAFDPADIGKSVASPDNPFFNRATQGNFPPGSVFKIATAIGGLESQKIDENTEFDDVGVYELGGEKFSNWFYNQYGKTDGLIKIERAIARSNDVYFYKMAEKVGLDDLRKAALKLGFGQKTGIDVPDEAFGLVPDNVWKKSAIGDGWYTGDTLHLAIGQGYMLVTPLQINAMTAYVASGKLTKPFIVSKVEPGLGAGEISFPPMVEAENIFDKNNINLIRRGMKAACESGGTGVPFFSAKYKVGCKTGTAEEAGGPPHAWFTAYGPFDKPEIAMTVVVERAGEGSAVAAPVAKDIFDWWMSNRSK